MSTHVAYPVTVSATLDPQLSRWKWVVKWFLAIPHFVVLALLWVAYAVLSIAAFFAILFTARYPRGIFEFNAGVLRWSWRVSYYALGAMGTDQYPPFTLKDVPEYPAHFDVAYPEHLSRGLVLVKWWLLAIPHYVITGILMGGTWFAWRNEDWRGSSIGLIGVLALVAVVTLAATGTYPKPLFDLILGLNRWVLRVAAYAGLMTDQYPPFRLDTGGAEAGVAPPPAATVTSDGRGWTAGRVTGLVAGVLMSFVALAIGGAGGVGLWADLTQRDAAGFLVTSSEAFATDSYAVVAEDLSIPMEGPDRLYPERLLGDARVRVTSLAQRGPVFVGIAAADDVGRYLDGVGYARAEDFLDDVQLAQRGGPPATAPAEQDFWVRSSSGEGTQTIRWPVKEGEWTIVAMNANGEAGVSLSADAGLEAPSLTGIAVGFLVVGGVLLAVAVFVVARVTSKASRAA